MTEREHPVAADRGSKVLLHRTHPDFLEVQALGGKGSSPAFDFDVWQLEVTLSGDEQAGFIDHRNSQALGDFLREQFQHLRKYLRSILDPDSFEYRRRKIVAQTRRLMR